MREERTARPVPVLDDDTRDFGLVGWADNEASAVAILRAGLDTDQPIIGALLTGAPRPSWNPDAQTREEAAAVIEVAVCWVPLYGKGDPS